MTAQRTVARVADCDDVIADGGKLPVPLDIRNATNALHISQDSTDSGGYVDSAGMGAIYVTGGATYEGFTTDYVFTAKWLHASGLIKESGRCTFWSNDGLTPEATFTPTYSWQIDRNHNLKSYGLSSTGTNLATAIIATNLINNVNASYTGTIEIGALDFTGNSRIGLQVSSDGTQVLIGLNGATPVAKGTITGSKGSNAALASLLTFLALRGDIIDGTS